MLSAGDAGRGAPGPGDGSGLAAVFEPRRIALVGASDRAGTVGRLLWDNLADFPGEVLPVSQSATVGGQAAYPSLRDVPGQVDLAIIATPAATVPDIIRAAAEAKVTAAVVLSAGFAETGPAGAKLQAEAVAAARAGGVRIVGPNCFGVQNADLPLNASIAAGTPRGGGGVSIVTQSGSYGMAVHALGQDEGLRVAKVFAAGNKADITDAELLGYLRQDPETRVICLILESITDARRFFDEACRTTPVKPVIAVVGGRTGAGQRAAVSHTAALATDDAVRDAALRQAGSGPGAHRPAGPRRGPGPVRPAGAARAAGRGDHQLRRHRGGAHRPAGRRRAGRPRAEPGPAGEAAGAAARLRQRRQPGGHDPGVAPVHHRLPGGDRPAGPVGRGQRDRAGAVAALRVAGTWQKRSGTPSAGSGRMGFPCPVYVCWVAPRAADPHMSVLQEAGVPCFPWPQRAAQAVGTAVRCGLQVGESGRAGAPASQWAPQRLPLAHRRLQPAVPPVRGLLAAETARELLVQAGVPVIETVRCHSPETAAAAAERLGYPVVIKVDHPEPDAQERCGRGAAGAGWRGGRSDGLRGPARAGGPGGGAGAAAA